MGKGLWIPIARYHGNQLLWLWSSWSGQALHCVSQLGTLAVFAGYRCLEQGISHREERAGKRSIRVGVQTISRAGLLARLRCYVYVSRLWESLSGS